MSFHTDKISKVPTKILKEKKINMKTGDFFFQARELCSLTYTDFLDVGVLSVA